MMNDARNQAKCKSQSDNPVDWRGHGPPWIRAEHWDSLVSYWNTDKWKNNAKIAKENRIKQGQDGEMKKHSTGSVSFVTTKKRLDKYKASIEFKYGTDRDNQPEFDPDSWINAVNGPSKGGRIYGFGPRQPVSHVLGTPASTRRSILAHDIMSNEDVNKLKSEFASTRNTIEENNERIANLTVRLERVEKNHNVELRDTVRNMLRELNIPNTQFPSSSRSRNNDI
ncbi:Uncharacterized protein Adt_43033 [Abeliophyllum distichum]|uniref:Uncharacterized protein n=1 Tax=Abeliophyllum distichum TaxID=126358 RepID=A0ABD1PUB5_9LAMI